MGAVGIAGRWLAWPLLTSTVGPTAYVFAAHPHSEAARFRNALIGHGVAIACGLGALALFGLVAVPLGQRKWVAVCRPRSPQRCSASA